MNKGFTLVELLATIILLTVLSGLVLFSVNYIINSSKKSLNQNQINTIEKAAQSYYLKDGINKNKNKSCVTVDFLIDNGYIDDEKIKSFVSNKKFDGHVEITFNSNQYNYKYKDGKCPTPICTIVNGDGKNIGDEIECAKEHFYIINIKEEEISMLSKYNLYVGNTFNESTGDINEVENPTGIQNSIALGYVTNSTVRHGTIAFSEYEYWYNFDIANMIEKYNNRKDGNHYVYDNNSLLYEYIENYKAYLQKKGVIVTKGSLMSFEKLVELGCDASNINCRSSKYSWVYLTSYWTGSIDKDNYVWRVDSNGDLGGFSYGDSVDFGVRPVITISKDSL